MEVSAGVFLGQLHNLLIYFKRDHVLSDEQKATAVSAIGDALRASMRYMEELRTDPEEERVVMDLWHKAAAELAFTSDDLAQRFLSPLLDWRQGINWSHADVLRRKDDFEEIQTEFDSISHYRHTSS